ncbi:MULTISPECIES: rRNA maturation RNase YbeY [Prochlorococcus]|uniref:rRNA maturation RNase YbeY n=1 Tax=Prochlorococcus TaxID=1218 RepID=UPI000533BBBF|nr:MULTISPECIES: rRNA maturation RNase YbeY [Prochlorococcus]KGG13190.1 Metal-dependent hydrolase YbeY [Prochlorococcus sp. MIT 0601]
MYKQKKIPSEVNLELAFHGFKDSNKMQSDLLIDSEIWLSKLESWIKFIRINDLTFCPNLVKEVNQFSIGLHLVNDEDMIKINKQWRHKDEVTDVISFPTLDKNSLFSPQLQCIELGDIIVSVQTANKQANEQKHSLTRELCWLVTHGLLHLLGWDHPTEMRLDEMLNFQDKLLKIKDTSSIVASGGIYN